MKRFMIMIAATFLISSCSSMHDGKGWEHTGDAETHQDEKSFVLEHKH